MTSFPSGKDCFSIFLNVLLFPQINIIANIAGFVYYDTLMHLLSIHAKLNPIKVFDEFLTLKELMMTKWLKYLALIS